MELAPGEEWCFALEPLREGVTEISETFCRTHVTSRPEIKTKTITNARVHTGHKVRAKNSSEANVKS